MARPEIKDELWELLKIRAQKNKRKPTHELEDILEEVLGVEEKS